MKLPDLRSELSYRAVTGGGPGGQHVNRAATKVEVRWRPGDSRYFTDAQRGRLAAKLAPRLTGDGELVLSDHATRSQSRNRERVTARLYEVVERALRREKPRRKTKPTKASKRRRLEGKRRRGEKKAARGRVRW